MFYDKYKKIIKKDDSKFNALLKSFIGISDYEENIINDEEKFLIYDKLRKFIEKINIIDRMIHVKIISLNNLLKTLCENKKKSQY